jgi:ABC-type lipoprotein export system ATPase subunit/GNAT superfamily N-acetyltransferase
MKLDFTIETELSKSPRVRQLEAMFDCPAEDKCRIRFSGDFPYDAEPWNVGLIVGPSGAGKSTVMRKVFGEPPALDWGGKAVIDDFAKGLSMEQISGVCSAVGFNTIPAWMRPYAVLSTGEKFRVEIARRMLETDGPIIVDEFTSVVDRQVAKIGSHAVQKWVRKNQRQFVAVTCHYDVIEWLQPDWVLEPATMTFTRRCLQRRPTLSADIARTNRETWELFSPFHYMSGDVNWACRFYVLFAEGEPASMAAMMVLPGKTADVIACSRLVTLPDWQGIGAAMILIERLGAAYKAIGKRVHTYPAHPSLIRAFDKSPIWSLRKKPGRISHRNRFVGKDGGTSNFGGRPNAVFEFCGAADESAKELVQ